MPSTTPIPDPAAFDSALLASRFKALQALDRILDTAQNPRQLHAAAVAILRLKPASTPPAPHPAPSVSPAPPDAHAPARAHIQPATAPPPSPSTPPSAPVAFLPPTRRPTARLLRASAGVAPSRPSPASPPPPPAPP